MDKWIFVNNITSLDKLYILTKTIKENNITDDNHALLLMNALNDNGASRNEANSHPINYTLFYNMTYFDGQSYKLTKNGENLLKEYEKICNESTYKAEFFFKILNKIEFPNIAVGTSNTYQIHPFNIIFKLLCEYRLNYYITLDEFENILSIAHYDSDYDFLVNTILHYRRGEITNIECDKIAQVTTIVAGWCNQFNVMKREGEKIMISDDLKSMLPILSDERKVSILPYSQEFVSFAIRKYLFDGMGHAAIEKEIFKRSDRTGFFVSDILNYYQINNENNKALYQGKDIDFVCSLLDIQSDNRYKVLSAAIKQKVAELDDQDLDILKKFIIFYDNNIDRIKETEDKIPDRLKQEFYNEYPIESFKTMKLEDYALGFGNPETFCAKVENGKYKNFGFSCSGDRGGSRHWGIYFDNEIKKYKDKEYNILDNPYEYWDSFKNELHDFLINLKDENPIFSNEYPLLNRMTKTLAKLCYMYYPDKFLDFLTKDILHDYYDLFGLEYNSKIPADKLSYDLNRYIRENVPNSKNESSQYITSVIGEFKNYIENYDNKIEYDNNKEFVNDIDRIKGGYNKIYYGVPGSGKSFAVKKIFNEDDYKVYRTTFHPEYTNSDFIGQIIPKLYSIDGKNMVSYEFNEGPLTEALIYALTHKEEKVVLIIEEINRGNASAIFGDIFQLLDRNDDGNSRYPINNRILLDHLKNDKKIRISDEIIIPSNLWIIGTMNTSDQNVFTLDTAFKRRWKMKYIRNDFDYSDDEDELKNLLNEDDKQYTIKLRKTKIPNVDISWEKFVKVINEKIEDDESNINSEDKQLGMYFVTLDELSNEKEFAEKILSYIWEDVAKLNPEEWFGDINSYEKLWKKYQSDKIKVFNGLFDNYKIHVEENKDEKSVDSNTV